MSTADRLRLIEDIFTIEGDGLELFLLRNFLSEEDCETLVKVVDDSRFPSTVLGIDPERSFRSSDSSALGYSGHPLVATIDAKLSSLLGIDLAFGEPMEAQRYTVGQQFKPHHDYFHVSEAYWPREERSGGQRTWTAMVCFGAPDAGGGTLFPEAGVRFKPRRGNLLAWCNLLQDGQVNHNSLHAGEPVEQGRKYVVTKWYRERPFTPQEAIDPSILQSY